MKIFFTIILIVAIAFGAYSFWGPSEKASSVNESSSSKLTSPDAIAKNALLDQYENLIKSYESRGGLKTQSDMLQFNSEMQSWSAKWGGNMTGLSADELTFIQNRLQSLTARQMKLMGR